MCEEMTPADKGIESAKQDARNAARIARRNDALRHLAHGYRKQAAEYIYSDQRFTECIMECMTDFIDEHLDVITDDDARVDLAMILMDKLTLSAWEK